jgi:hypothetical protein
MSGADDDYETKDKSHEKPLIYFRAGFEPLPFCNSLKNKSERWMDVLNFIAK